MLEMIFFATVILVEFLFTTALFLLICLIFSLEFTMGKALLFYLAIVIIRILEG